MSARPGDQVAHRFSKWGGDPHWACDAVTYLGTDRHGRWFGVPAGTRYARPGAEFTTAGQAVMLVPGLDRWFVATFSPFVPQYRWRVYVDITTPAVLADGVLSCVDLDLDVVQGFDGVVEVEDETEFAEHQQRYGYPADVVARAQAECARVTRELATGATAYAERTVRAWRARL